MSTFKNLPADQHNVFESIIYHPGQPHTGPTIAKLLARGLVYEVDGKYYPYTTALQEWEAWRSGRPDDLDVDGRGRPYNGVKVK